MTIIGGTTVIGKRAYIFEEKRMGTIMSIDGQYFSVQFIDGTQVKVHNTKLKLQEK